MLTLGMSCGFLVLAVGYFLRASVDALDPWLAPRGLARHLDLHGLELGSLAYQVLALRGLAESFVPGLVPFLRHPDDRRAAEMLRWPFNSLTGQAAVW